MYNKWKLVQLWILYSWSFLTMGILLGSWWAYHELGWGGWWFWDPVENASLMPWLLATSGLHSITKRKLNSWTSLYVQATFFLSILGTFFVRSGFLGSVHSFATDSTRGFFLLIFFLCLLFFSFLNWISPRIDHFAVYLLKIVPKFSLQRMANLSFSENKNFSFARQNNGSNGFLKKKANLRAFFFFLEKTKQVAEKGKIKFFDLENKREKIEKKLHSSWSIAETLLFFQGFYFALICFVVFCGTSAPLFFFFIWNRDIGTGAPFYNGTLVPLFSSLLFILTLLHYFPYLKMNSTKHFIFPILVKTWLCRKIQNRVMKFQLSYFSALFYFFLHILVFYYVIGFHSLSSIYGALCLLITSTFFLSTNHVFAKTSWPLFHFMESVPSRYTNVASSFCRNDQAKNFLEKEKILHQNFFLKEKQKNLFAVLQDESPKVAKSQLAMKTGHLGLMFFLTGILFSNAFKTQFTQLFQPGSSTRIGTQVCCLRGIDHSFAPTFQSICANLFVYPSSTGYKLLGSTVDFQENYLKFFPFDFSWVDLFQERRNRKKETNLFENSCFQDRKTFSNVSMFPEKRFYYSSVPTSTTKVAIHSNFLTDLYSSIGTGSFQTGWFTTVMKLPAIFSLWLGFFFGVVAGFLSIRKQLEKSKLEWV